MDRVRLTKARVERLKPPATGERYVRDAQVPGLAVRVRAGGSKRWVLEYRVNGQQRRATLARADVLSPDDARTQALALLAKASAGVDPLARKPKEITLGTAVERYHSDHLVKLKSGNETLRNLKTRALPAFGRRKLSTLTRGDVAAWHAEMGRERVATANRCLAALSGLYTHAIAWGLVDANPCLGIRRFREVPRDRWLRDDELVRLGATLEKLDREGDHRQRTSLAAMRFLLLTGVRKSEALGLRWDHLDEGNALFRLPDSKNARPTTIYLEGPSLALVQSLPRTSAWVFPGQNPERPLNAMSRAWANVCKHAQLEGVTIHDLRRTVGSQGAAMGVPLQALSRVLGHTKTSITERHYAHLAPDPIRRAAARIQDHIAAALEGQEPAEVVELDR